MVVRLGTIWRAYAKNHIPQIRSGWRQEAAWKRLKPLFDNLSAGDITPDVVENYCASRSVTDATINRELAVLSAIIGYGRKTGMINVTPFIQKRSASVPRLRVLSDEEIAKLLEVCRDDDALSIFVKIALLTAQRRTAIVELKWTQVNRSTNIVDFRDHLAVNQSRMKGRGMVPIRGELVSVFDSIPITSPYVISAWDGNVKLLNKAFQKACSTAGFTDVTPHTLRHTVATRLVRRGVPLLKVSRLLGHKSVTTTEANYLSLTPDYIADAAEQLTLS